MPGKLLALVDTLYDPLGLNDSVFPELHFLLRSQVGRNDVGDDGLAVKVLYEATAMTDYQSVQLMKRGLSIAVDMNNYPPEYLWFGGVLSEFGIEVLQLRFLPPHVLAEPAKTGGAILVALLIIEGMTLDSLAEGC